MYELRNSYDPLLDNSYYTIFLIPDYKVYFTILNISSYCFLIPFILFYISVCYCFSSSYSYPEGPSTKDSFDFYIIDKLFIDFTSLNSSCILNNCFFYSFIKLLVYLIYCYNATILLLSFN